MIATRLVRLIQEHSGELARTLVDRGFTSERMSDMRKVPPEELRQRAYEIYHNLNDWLLTKTEADIECWYTGIGVRRASQGVRLSHLLAAMQMVKAHLLEYLKREGLVDRHVELFQELELLQAVDRFFDLAMYYAARGYEHAAATARHSEVFV